MFTKVPAFRNATFAGCRPDRDHPHETSGGDVEDKPLFPVITFSHGLGGSRMHTSSVCGELASNGSIVVAVEHRGGSGART